SLVRAAELPEPGPPPQLPKGAPAGALPGGPGGAPDPAPAPDGDGYGKWGKWKMLFTGYPREPDSLEPCWFDVEYLAWWLEDGRIPFPVATTNPIPASNGDIGRVGPTVSFLKDNLDYHTFNGLRMTLGLWLCEENDGAFEFSGFFLEQRQDGFALSS